MSKPKKPPPRHRTAVRPDGNHVRLTALLDFQSSCALQYAQTWAARQRRLKVSSSVIARRALQHYVAHLETLKDIEAGTEWRLIDQAAKDGKVSSAINRTLSEPEARQAALERLTALVAIPAGLPLPSFQEVLYGASEVAVRAARFASVNQAVQGHLQDIASTRYGRLLGLSSFRQPNAITPTPP